MKKPHRYRFSVFALDAMLLIPGDSDAKQLRAAIREHLIGSVEMLGICVKGKSYRPCFIRSLCRKEKCCFGQRE